MATGLTNPQNIPYPQLNDPVNVHSDMQDMAERVNDLLTALQVPYLSLDVINDSGNTLQKGTPVYISGYLNGRASIDKTDSSDINTFPCIGLVKSQILDGQEGVVVTIGVLEDIDTSSYSDGDKLYVSSGGGLTNIQPGDGISVIAIVIYSDSTAGKILVSPIKGGNSTWGSIKNGL